MCAYNIKKKRNREQYNDNQLKGSLIDVQHRNELNNKICGDAVKNAVSPLKKVLKGD